MRNKQRLLKLVSVTLTLATVYFGFKYLVRLINDSSLGSKSINYPMVVIASLLFVCFYAILSIHWDRVCKKISNNQKSQILSFFASQPYKYLPTSLFTFSFRAKYSKQLGMSVKKSSTAQLVENFNLLSTGMTTGLVFWLIYTGRTVLLLTAIALIVLVILKIPTVINLRFKDKKLIIDKKEQLINMVFVSVAWIIAGLSFFTLSIAIGENIGIIGALSSNALAYTSGIFAFFAPGGIGVREWVFALFGIMGKSIITWRVLTFVADLILGFAGIFVIHKKTKLS